MHRMKLALGAVALAASMMPSGPAAQAATFTTPVVVSGNDVIEPGIEVAPDGTLYVHAPPGIPLWSSMWRSNNGGSTWQVLPPLVRYGLGGGDIEMTIQPNGALAITDLWLGSSSVGKSTNKGDLFVMNQFQGIPSQDRQFLANTGRDIVYHVTHQIPAGHTVSKSLDGGLTYQQHTVAATVLDQTGCVCPPGNLIASPGIAVAGGTDDRVGLIYYTSLDGIKFARSINGGLTWQNVEVDLGGGGVTGGGFPIVADDGNGKLHAVWGETTGNSSVIKYSTSSYTNSQNWGTVWSAPTTLIGTGANVFPWIDARGDKVAVSVFHSNSNGNPNSVPESAQWHISYMESLNDGATWSALQAADPTPVKSGPICTEGLNCAEDRELGDFQMVAMNSAGMAHLAYNRSIDGQFDTEVRFVKQTS